jgi:hypothetical protein
MTDTAHASHAAAASRRAVAGYGPGTALAAVAAITAVRLVYLAFEVYPLHADEAQYWSWSLDPAFGYYSKPPMLAWLIWLTTQVAGHGEFGVRLASPLVHAVTAMMLYLTGRRLFDARVGVWSAVVWATLPAVSLSAVIASTDAPLLMFWSIALYAFVRAVQEDRPAWWAGCGLALGLALLSKYAAIAFPASALLYLLLSRDRRPLLRRPGPYLALALAILLLLPNLAWNAAHGWLTVGHVGENAAFTEGALLNPKDFAEFVGAQFGVFGPILFGALLVVLARWRRETRDDRMLLLLCFVAPLLAAICGQALLSRAHANWAAAIYVAATVAVVAALLRERRRRWLLWASLGLHLVAAAGLYGVELVRPPATEWPLWTDPARRLRGWDEVGAALADRRAAHPGTLLLSDERRYLAHYLYDARVPPEEAFKWNPEGRIDDHYELVNDLNAAVGRDVLFVTRWGDRGVSARFESAVRLPDIRVPTHSDSAIVLQVYLMRGFQGY